MNEGKIKDAHTSKREQKRRECKVIYSHQVSETMDERVRSVFIHEGSYIQSYLTPSAESRIDGAIRTK